MRTIGARHVVVATLLLVLAGCKSGGTAGSSWWNANPFKSSAATPTNPGNPYPPKPSQLYANSATSAPTSGISAGSPTSSSSLSSSTGSRSPASSVSGGARSGSTASGSPAPRMASAGSTFAGTTSSAGTGESSYPATRASYTAAGPGTRSGPLQSPTGSSGTGAMGSSVATDAISPQRGYYSAAPNTVTAGGGPATGSGNYASGKGGPSPSGDTPFRSPSVNGPRFDTPSNRYGNSGVKDPFLSPSDRSGSPATGPTQGFYPVTSNGAPQAGRGTGTGYGPSAVGNGPTGASGWSYPNDPRASGFRSAGPAGGVDRSYSAPPSASPAGMDRGSPVQFGPGRSDDRPTSPAYPSSGSEYRPGSTGYQPPASEYRPGQTGYTPPAPGTGYSAPHSGAGWGSGTASAGTPFRYPATTSSGSGMPPEDAPYRPGSVTEYPPRSPAPTGAGSPASVSNPWVTPNSYGNSTTSGSFSTGSGGTLR